MRIPIYQVDAFASAQFRGNPAAVCPLLEWLPDAKMQTIAAENNLSETAFLVEENDGYRIRWFTPTVEIDLCGHATLAAAFVLYKYCEYQGDKIAFYSKSGPLGVSKAGDKLQLDFPESALLPATPEPILVAQLGVPDECYKGDDYFWVLPSEQAVIDLAPDFGELAKVSTRGVIVTAPGTDCDFVVRFFAPAAGINEDPVTGSAYTVAMPYWSRRLNKQQCFARQLSSRGGEIWCEMRGERVLISGEVQPYLQGEIQIL